MNIITRRPAVLPLLALLSLPASAGLAAQEPLPPEIQPATVVYGAPPADLTGLTEGARIDGFISARNGDRMQVTGADGVSKVVAISEATQIRGNGGFLGLGRNRLDAGSLLNGLPVSVETRQWGNDLVASRIELKSKDLRTASMIRNGTDQRFAEQTAATEALRGRMGDIDKYNIKGTTNVNFAVGQSNLSPEAKSDLCATASQADATENALMLVVGYTDSTGSEELNQQLSEKRASRVVNYLQQTCGWKPYRMLTPAGMAEADPLADNTTAYGKAQNRRVAVNILVSKSVDGL